MPKIMPKEVEATGKVKLTLKITININCKHGECWCYELAEVDLRTLLNVPLCLAHIKISDRAIKILSVCRPIYSVRLSQIGRRRAFTFKICTADHSWEHFCLASVGHRPSIGRQSGDILGVGRPMIGRPVTDRNSYYIHAYYISVLAYYNATLKDSHFSIKKQVFTAICYRNFVWSYSTAYFNGRP